MPQLKESKQRTYCDVIAEHLAKDDISHFIDWNVIRFTMFCVPPLTALYYLQNLPDWNSKWKNAIRESPIGNPVLYSHYPQSSGNIIHQANHLAHFFSKTKCRLEDIDRIFEFGAGYGCMCRLIYNLGFSGEYLIMDLPVVLELQRYYLSETVERRIDFVSDVTEFTERMQKSNNLFIATWSLCEVPFSLREEVLDRVCTNVNYILLAIGTYGNYDNDAFFADYIERNTSHHWQKVFIPYLSHLGCYYLFGERQSSND